MEDQPKSKLTLNDLEKQLSFIFNMTIGVTKSLNETNIEQKTLLTQANSILQELIVLVVKTKTDLDVIGTETVENKTVQTIINTEKAQFTVCGVQLIENGILVGTSLYSTVIKARKIRDVLNAKFAELKVNHGAKIVNYPVF